MKAPLEGIKVIEWSVWATGPLAGVMLSDLGADVIKIEDGARGGDPPRNMRYVAGIVDCQMPAGRNAYFEVMNWNKRSVTLNLKHPQGRELALRLLDQADVFIINVHPASARRCGLDYETVAQRNPNIIYAVATGYGGSGPEAERGGVDYTGQARSGMMWSAGTSEDPPFYQTGGFADMAGGTLLAQAVVAALLARERHGVGQKVELSNLSAAMWIQYWALSIVLLTGQKWPRVDRRTPGNALWNHYRCKDGEWLALANLLPEDWPLFCRLVGLHHLLEDKRFLDTEGRRVNAAELVALLDTHFLTRTRAQWQAVLRKEPRMVLEGVQHLHDLANDAQALANEYVVDVEHPVYGRVKAQNFPIRFAKTPVKPRRPAPDLGENNLEVLTSELGYTPEEVARFIASGAIA